MSTLDYPQVIKTVFDASNAALQVNVVTSVAPSLPAGAATEATLAALNAKVTAVDTGAVTISGALPAGTAAIGKLAANNGVDIGDVTVNNGSGASSVNIQDGGNSLTVDGTVAATQSGAWNITDVSGTVSLPTGASTEATLSTLNGKVPANLTVTSTRLLVDGSGVTQPVSVASLPLPSLAATAAKQDTGNTSLASIDGKITAVNTGAVVVASGTLAATQSGTWSVRNQDGAGNLLTSKTIGSNQALQVNTLGFTLCEFIRNDYSSVNVTTGAYVELIASTANEYQEVQIMDTSGQTLKLAIGAALSEVDKFIIPPGGTFPIKFRIASGSRISIRAISGTASTGEVDVQFLG